jgi:hypothetical protein
VLDILLAYGNSSLKGFRTCGENFLTKEYTMDLGEVLNRAIKYLIEGIAVGLAAIIVPRKGIDLQEVIALAIVAATVFAVLDLVSPSIGVTARQGAGFGIGANLVGFPRA